MQCSLDAMQNLFTTKMDTFVEQAIDQLTQRLRYVKNACKPLFNGVKVKSNNVMPEIREEIVKLYDEHGGVDILVKITKISYEVIKDWHKAWIRDPNCFQKIANGPKLKRSRKSFVGRVLAKKSESSASKSSFNGKLPISKLRKYEFKGATTPEEIKSKLPEDIVAKCEEIRKEIFKRRESGMTAIRAELKREVVRLCLKAGHTRPISLLIGLSEKLMKSWKNFYDEDLLEEMNLDK